MTRRARLWRAGAVLFGIINIGGIGIALAMDEMMHAMAHVFLLFVGIGAYLLWKTVTTWASGDSGHQRTEATALPPSRGSALPSSSMGLTQQLQQQVSYLQSSMDALAVEVERIGEAQRFRDKQYPGKGETTPPKKPDV